MAAPALLAKIQRIGRDPEYRRLTEQLAAGDQQAAYSLSLARNALVRGGWSRAQVVSLWRAWIGGSVGALVERARGAACGMFPPPSDDRPPAPRKRSMKGARRAVSYHHEPPAVSE